MFKAGSITHTVVCCLPLATLACGQDTQGLDADRPATETVSQAIVTGWTSEEFPPARCGAGEVAFAAECSGAFCDDIRLNCDTRMGTLGTDTPWTAWVDANGQARTTCPNGYWADGIACRGGNCDDVALICRNAPGKAHDSCRWTADTFSDGDGWMTAPTGFAIAGVECMGRHCDDKRYFLCRSRPSAANSCAGRCGNFDPGAACQCDTACSTWGDCCIDYALQCG